VVFNLVFILPTEGEVGRGLYSARFCPLVRKILLASYEKFFLQLGRKFHLLLTLQSYGFFMAVPNFRHRFGAILNTNSGDFQQGYDR